VSEPELLTGREVARMFGVGLSAVTDWAKSGKLDTVRTPGNQRRYFRVQVLALRAGGVQEAGEP
jgi:excisionase family DNA binding protein